MSEVAPEGKPRRRAPTLAEQIEALRGFRGLSAEVQGAGGRALGQGAAYALAALAEADECVDGILHLLPNGSGRQEMPTPIGVLGRSLLEGAINLSYVAKNRDVRFPQLVNSGLDEFYKHISSQSRQQAGDDPLSKVPRKVLEDIKSVRAANRRPKPRCRTCFPNDEEPPAVPPALQLLPPTAKMAEDIGATWQYEVSYRWESGAVHFGFHTVMNRVVFNEADERYEVVQERPRRLLEVLSVCTTAYAMLLRAIAILLVRPIPSGLRDLEWAHIPLADDGE